MTRFGTNLLHAWWDLDPHFWARRCRWIVGPDAGTVIPVRLRLPLHDNWRRLYDDLRLIVVRRVIPPRTPPECGAGNDDAVTMKVTVESGVPVKTWVPAK